MNAKETFECVCSKIADIYMGSGWSYSKSKHWLTKKTKSCVYRVYLYTSWSNISGKSVTFYGEFAIINPITKNKFFNINTHQCNIPDGELYWNIANEETWDVAIKEFTTWIDTLCMPIVEESTNNLEGFVKKVVAQGFYPPKGYVIDIDFVLRYGSRELAEEATKRYYDNLKEDEKKEFKENYESMIAGHKAVSKYGDFQMLNYSNFRTIIENKISVNL